MYAVWPSQRCGPGLFDLDDVGNTLLLLVCNFTGPHCFNSQKIGMVNKLLVGKRTKCKHSRTYA